MVLSFIVLIIFERILNRTDTKKVHSKNNLAEQKFLKKDDLFKKS